MWTDKKCMQMNFNFDTIERIKKLTISLTKLLRKSVIFLEHILYHVVEKVMVLFCVKWKDNGMHECINTFISRIHKRFIYNLKKFA